MTPGPSPPMLDLLVKGGWLTIPIMLCSVAGLGIFLERLLRYHRLQVESDGLLDAVIRAVAAGDFGRARALTDTNSTPMGRLLASGVSVCCKDRSILETVLNHATEQEINALSRRLPALATIGTITPLLGLLGTVVGMIKAFMVIEEAGCRVDASLLAGGIWEAMLTTAFGLAVALPVLIAHAYLLSKVSAIESRLEFGSVQLMKTLSGYTRNTGEDVRDGKTRAS